MVVTGWRNLDEEPMRIADSARQRLEALLAGAAPRSAISLLVGYTYDEHFNKIPQVDIAVMPLEAVSAMARDMSRTAADLVQQLDGFAFVLPLSDDEGLLEGQVLIHTSDGFSLERVTH